MKASQGRLTDSVCRYFQILIIIASYPFPPLLVLHSSIRTFFPLESQAGKFCTNWKVDSNHSLKWNVFIWCISLKNDFLDISLKAHCMCPLTFLMQIPYLQCCLAHRYKKITFLHSGKVFPLHRLKKNVIQRVKTDLACHCRILFNVSIGKYCLSQRGFLIQYCRRSEYKCIYTWGLMGIPGLWDECC